MPVGRIFLCYICFQLRLYSRKPLRLVKLGSSLGGLCTGQECLAPRSRYLGEVSSVFGPKRWVVSSTQMLVTPEKVVKIKDKEVFYLLSYYSEDKEIFYLL